MADSEDHGHHDEHVTAGVNAVESEWQSAWYEGERLDANRETSKWLKQYISKLTEGKTGLRVFVPMCGASRDMHWLLEQGHEVIGVELVDKALRLFLDRHSIKHTVEDVPSVQDGKCYRSEDKKLTLYKGNIFHMNMSLIGNADCVWDCGAMTDIPPAERIRYGEIISSALSSGGRILAETFTFGEIKGDVCSQDNHGHDHGHDHHHGQEPEYSEDFPCRPVEMEDFQKMYGETCTIELIDEEDSAEQEEWGPNWWAKNRLHLLIVK